MMAPTFRLIGKGKVAALLIGSIPIILSSFVAIDKDSCEDLELWCSTLTLPQILQFKNNECVRETPTYKLYFIGIQEVINNEV